jgi:hypothetical protein
MKNISFRKAYRLFVKRYNQSTNSNLVVIQLIFVSVRQKFISYEQNDDIYIIEDTEFNLDSIKDLSDYELRQGFQL